MIPRSLLRGVFIRIAEATAYLRQVRDQAAISVITRAEVLTGFEPSDRQQATALLDCYALLEITKPIANLAAELRVSMVGNCPTPSR